MYECRSLELNMIGRVYREHMTKDFPEDELKPFHMIKKAVDRNEYECYGIFDKSEICGYACFVRITRNGRDLYLLDYFATVNGKRGKGIGSEFLGLLRDAVRNADIIICEVENPHVSDDDEKITRQRRMDFYLRNEFVNTNVTARIFGVEYVLLEMPSDRPHSEENVKYAYSELYKSFLPSLFYKKFFSIN